ncbi:MAG: trypsin-like peptidase domain-containing protein [Spirochaetales bacterium]|nr:trypsin-like peptidase domain-containing protein [Spirochaetales bacterium]
MNNIRWTLSLILFAALLSSCVSEPEFESEVDPLGNPSLERIDQLLEQGENLRALPLIVARSGLEEDLSERREQALAGLQAEWEASRADGDWQRSLTYYRSFLALGMESPSITERELYLEGVLSHLQAQESGAAALLLQDQVGLSTLSQEEQEFWAQKFLDAGYDSFASRIRGGEGQDVQIDDLVDGTVTVWVNRGIRLVGNVGVPDRGIGSAFFVGPEGYLLTNYHVIESEVDPEYQGYSRLYIKADEDSGERFPAKVVGWDENFDLALLKTEMDVPWVFDFANQNVPALGERIRAIGSPGGLSRSLTSGTVSAYARSIQPMAGSLQIDVPINPGNSGGPLLNQDGEVIGVVFAGVSGYEGVNFAIPGSYVKQLLPRLYEGGALTLPWLGTSAWDTSGAVRLTYVVPSSPAADAGLRPGDALLSIDGQSFATIRAVQEYLITRSPGTLVSLQWQRGEEKMEGLAALGVRPDVPLSTALSRDAREHLLYPLFGMDVERISGSGFHQNYRIRSVLPGSIADEAGFSKGDFLSLRRWIHDEKNDVVAIQMILKGRKAGFLESAIQIAARLNLNTVF